jgi:hypothetical protein
MKTYNSMRIKQERPVTALTILNSKNCFKIKLKARNIFAAVKLAVIQGQALFSRALDV